MARAIKLINAPVGLFDIDGVLVLKTEYSTQHDDGAITPDCYIVDSGEYFWGGVDSVEERNNLMVTPIDMPTLTPQNEWVSVEERLPEEKQRVIVRCERVGTSVGWILWGRWMTDIGPHAGDVTHWMPLPVPPYRRPPEGEA